ncbi:hypothetical protein TNCV_3789741 [Trichonephila clavipes]|nr:hypothetical protein TNCV_3789741 [Trichonephila clavipes]
MRSGTIILENKGISNDSSVRDDMRSKYLICIPSARPMTPASVRPPMLILPHTIQPALLYCDFSRMNAGLFRVSLSLHTRTRRVSHSRLNRDSSVNSTWLQSCCSQSRCSAAHLLQAAWWRGVNGMQTIGLRACVAFSDLFRRAVNCIYRSSVDVVARGRPAPGRRLTFPVSWNQLHSLATTLLATPTASATLRCVCPDFSLPITRHAMDSGKSR